MRFGQIIRLVFLVIPLGVFYFLSLALFSKFAISFGFGFLLGLASFPSAVSAAEDLEQVQWYRPEVQRSVKKNRARVRFSGQATPGTKIELGDDSVLAMENKGRVFKVSASEIWPERYIHADDRGIFEIYMDLPFFTVQIPVKVSTPNGYTSDYQLSFSVSRDDVRLAEKNIKTSPYGRRRWGFWGGAGLNLIQFEQNITEVPAGVAFNSVKGPALFAKVVRSLNRDWSVQGTINRSPGKTSASDSIHVTQGEYDWTFLTGELTYFPPHWKFPKKKSFNEFGLQMGLQHHAIPFFVSSSTTDAKAFSIETNDVTMVAAGMTSVSHYGHYWLFESFVRYQYPIISGDVFDIQPQFSVDASLGIIYKLKPNWRSGLFWYGQWHEYKFKNAKDMYTQSKVSGDQSLLFSDLEVRLGYEFD